MRGLNGKGVADNWSALLVSNEVLARRGKALTDDQLKQKMYEWFPGSKGRTTIERVRMVRSDYNAGRGMFAGDGPSGTKARPTSRRYHDGRTPAPQRSYTRKVKARKRK